MIGTSGFLRLYAVYYRIYNTRKSVTQTLEGCGGLSLFRASIRVEDRLAIPQDAAMPSRTSRPP
jgi:hypothetical protein